MSGSQTPAARTLIGCVIGAFGPRLSPRGYPNPRGRPQGEVIRIYNYVRLVRGGLN